MSRIDDTIQAKKEKREQLEAAGVTAHPHSFNKTHTVADAIAAEGNEQVVSTAGRLMSLRTHGRVAFADLKDTTGQIQLMFREQEVGKDKFKQLKKYIDSGDFLGVIGSVQKTQTGEITVVAQDYTFLGKALRPLPSSWNAADDKEVRFRKRYLDMLVNPEVKFLLDTRWLVEKEIRRYLQDKFDFTEVETPVLQPLYGGTNAKPFSTHMNALDSDYYLRIAPELYLKRLIVGGYERIFEIARNFRNEGIDQTHQPEFTMIEWYHSYADYNTMMDVAEGLIKYLVEKVHGESEIMVLEHKVDVGGNWPRLTMIDSLKQYADIDFNNLSDHALHSLMAKHKIELTSEFSKGKALFALFDELVTPHLIQPTWIIDYPRDVSPLAKAHRLDSAFAERFEAYIGGKELADGWSEIVDPIDQRNIFENEQKNMRAGDDEAHPLDEDFLEAMEYGMPPLGGIGMGIDRLIMFLTNTWSIKEVIAFPTLKPLASQQAATVTETKGHAAVIEEGADEDNLEGQAPVDSVNLPAREKAESLLKEYIVNPKLQHHCYMVADAMAAYAKELGQDEELWYQTGLLHDLDWEKYPDEHPNYAINTLLKDYPPQMLQAIAAHAPDRTGQKAETLLDKYLFACDEVSGFLHAVSIMRPAGFDDMKFKSVKKKLKDKSFAANVPREDIEAGAEMIGKPLQEHIEFLISVFS